MSSVIGGITITNFSKALIPIFFEKRNVKSIIKKIGISMIVFCVIFIFRMKGNIFNAFAATDHHYKTFSKIEDNTWDMIVSFFFGDPILFPSFYVRDVVNDKGLFCNTYTHPIQYLFVLVIFLFLFLGVLFNFKNKFVHILCLFFSVDIIIHCVLHFGLDVSFIYGAHWVFVIPLLIGWFFYACKKNRLYYNIGFITLVVMTVFLIINNIYRMTEFIQFINTFYKL